MGIIKLSGLIILMLFFVSCSNNAKNTSDIKVSTVTPSVSNSTSAITPTPSQEAVKAALAPVQKEAAINTPAADSLDAALSNGMTLTYKRYNGHTELKLKESNTHKEINLEGVRENGEYVSKPVVSPDKCKFVYLAPFAWEAMGEIIYMKRRRILKRN